MLRRVVAVLVLVCVSIVPAAGADEASPVFSPWRPGSLDIHHLATGQGNATFFLLPDGTSLLYDAGDVAGQIAEVPGAAGMPDGASRGMVDYFRTVLEAAGLPLRIDYAVLSHFHGDHMGFVTDAAPRAQEGYALVGITAVGSALPFGLLIDRGWPDYDHPRALDHPGMVAYRAFVADHRARGMRVARLAVGRTDQIVLLGDGGAYPSFHVRGVAANGELWTGLGDQTRRQFPPYDSVPEHDWPNENMHSLALHLVYGRFRYVVGGDLPGVPDDGSPSFHDLETPIARAIGPVDVSVVNHHGSIDPSSAFFLRTTQPRVHVVPAWAPSHPAPVVLKRLMNERIYTGPRDIFVTWLRDATKATIGPRAGRVASDRGHVVVRVDPGGRRYRVEVLANDVPCCVVQSVHGPYASR